MSLTEHKIKLEYEDSVVLILPDGRKVSILLSYKEPGNQLPELDIVLPVRMMVNCFLDNFVPSKPEPKYPNVLETRQIIIPLKTE